MEWQWEVADAHFSLGLELTFEYIFAFINIKGKV